MTSGTLIPAGSLAWLSGSGVPAREGGSRAILSGPRASPARVNLGNIIRREMGVAFIFSTKISKDTLSQKDVLHRVTERVEG